MAYQIKSIFDDVLFDSTTATTCKKAMEEAVENGEDLSGADLFGANLSGANLSGANLSGADLFGAKIEDLLCLSELSDAIDIAPMIWKEWQKNGFDAAKKRFCLYQVSGEEKALIAMCPLLVGGFCFVLHRREIWFWQWSCPNPETVPVLWRETKLIKGE